MKEWKDDEVRIAWGIQINPSYLDGIYSKPDSYKKTRVMDRYGNIMNRFDVARLNRYRTEIRDEWRLENRDTIKNLKEGGDK